VAAMRWTIGRKVAALSVTGLALALVVGGVSYSGVRRIQTLTDEREQLVAADSGLTRLDTKLSDLSTDEVRAILSFTPATNAQAKAAYAADQTDIASAWATIDATHLPADLTASLAAFKTSYQAYVDQTMAELPKLLALPPTAAAATAAADAERTRVAPVSSALDAGRQQLSQRSAQSKTALASQIGTVETTIVVALVIGMIGLALLGTWITRLITRPVGQMVTALRGLARRDLTVQVDVTGGDEIADMAVALNEAVGSVRHAVETLAHSSSTLTTASDQLGGVSIELGHSAQRTAEQTDSISASAQQVAGSAGSMSAATEQMTASIGEIANQATRASAVASEAVHTAQETSEAVRELDRASAEIDEIVKVITSIAEQTNLLALNATIEAARAGDAGKGFAVVATEVKELAQETARATDDITSKISAIQSTTTRATEAIARISQVIAQINENQTTIAAAVEEQTATTSEISRSVNEVSSGSTHIADTIGGIAESAASTSTGAAATQQSADDLATLARSVRDLVSQFTV
jgi:methyl-accepting chemotaxis protein